MAVFLGAQNEPFPANGFLQTMQQFLATDAAGFVALKAGKILVYKQASTQRSGSAHRVITRWVQTWPYKVYKDYPQYASKWTLATLNDGAAKASQAEQNAANSSLNIASIEMLAVFGGVVAIGELGGASAGAAGTNSTPVDLGTTVTSNGGDIVAQTGADVALPSVPASVPTVTQAASVTEQASTYAEVGYTGTATVAPASYGAVGTAAQEAGALAESAGYAGAATQSAAVVSGGATVPQAVSVGEAAVSAGGKIAGAVVATEVTKAITPTKPSAPVAVAAAPKALIPAPLLFGGLGLGLLFFIL